MGVTAGGVSILEYLNADLVDEFSIALALVLFGSGTGLFEGVDASKLRLEAVSSEPSSWVTCPAYTVHAVAAYPRNGPEVWLV